MDQAALHEAAWRTAAAQHNHQPNNWLRASLLGGNSRLVPNGTEHPPRDLVDSWIRTIKSANCRRPQFWYLPHNSPQYPGTLLSTPDAPAGLFVIGQMLSLIHI